MSEFHAFELAGWSNPATVAAYDDGFGSVTRQAASHLLDALEIGSGTRLLDVASGPGYVVALATERGARATGIDFSPTMVEAARRRYPGIEFRAGDAQALDFADASFEAVAIGFGMLHFADPDQALREAFHVLVPGGRIAFTVWGEPGPDTGIGILRQAIERHGDMEVPLPPGPSQFRFSSFDECRRCLEAAGFVGVETRELMPRWQAAAPLELLDALQRSAVRLTALLAAQTPAATAAIREEFARGLQPFTVKEGVSVPMPVTLAAARRP